MKILHLDSEKTWRGGQAQVFYLASGLKERGHHVAVTCPKEAPLFKKCQRSGLTTYPVKMRGEWDMASAWQIARLIHKEKPQIIHIHSAHAHTLAQIALAFTFNSRPKVVLSRRVDFHIKKNPISYFKYRWGIDRIMAISSGIKQVLIQDGLAEEKIEVVHSGIDLSRFEVKGKAEYLYPELGLDPTQPIAGIIAALAPHKDHANFLKAASIVSSRLPRVKYLVVGEGELRKDLEVLCQEQGIDDKVRFLGFREDVIQILTILDLFVLSSYLEGLCTSLLDAQAAGVPIVATRTGGVPEIIKDGVNGLLVPPQDPKSLAEAIIRLLKDKVLANQMSIKGKEMVKEFSKEAMISKTEEVYTKLLAETFPQPSQAGGGEGYMAPQVGSYYFIQSGRWKGFYDPSHPEVLNLLQDIDSLKDKALTIFNHFPNVVAEVPLTPVYPEAAGEGKEIKVVVKSFGWRNLFHFLKSPLVKSKAISSLRVANHLLDHNLPTPKPLGAFEQREWGFVKRACYITESLGEVPTLRSYLRRRPEGEEGAKKTLQFLAGYVKRMHDSGLFHQDLTLGNFLMKDGQLYLVDLNRSRVKKRKLSFLLRIEDLARMDFPDNPDRELFFRFYFREESRPWILSLRITLIQIERRLKKLRKRIFRFF
ncbi:MAG: glycosyltransferase [bacterium]